jgi:hypothetical protein
MSVKLIIIFSSQSDRDRNSSQNGKHKLILVVEGTWSPQGQFIQQLPPQLDDLRYHHHPQYASSTAYHQPSAATGEKNKYMSHHELASRIVM